MYALHQQDRLYFQRRAHDVNKQPRYSIAPIPFVLGHLYPFTILMLPRYVCHLPEGRFFPHRFHTLTIQDYFLFIW